MITDEEISKSYKNILVNIKNLLNMAELSTRQISTVMGYSATTFSHVLSGDRKLSIVDFLKIAKLFNLRLDIFCLKQECFNRYMMTENEGKKKNRIDEVKEVAKKLMKEYQSS